MPLRAALVVVVVALAGCSSNRTVVPGVGIEEPTAYFTLSLPEGYRVVEASAETEVRGTDGSSRSRAYLSVLAEHVETGRRVLLIYQDVNRRTEPVAVYRFEEGGGGGGGDAGAEGGRW